MNRSRQLVLVLGMHRSGTSVLTKLLTELGCRAGNELLPQAPDNPDGFWEDKNVVALNEQFLAEVNSCWNDPFPLSTEIWESEVARKFKSKATKLIDRDYRQAPISVLKDPRLCRLLPLWRTALESRFEKIRCILMMRHFSEVSQSLAHRNGFSEHLTTLLWIQHVLLAELGTENWPRILVTFPSLLNSSHFQLKRIGAFLDMPESPMLESTAASVRPELRHFKEVDREIASEIPAYPLASRIWESRRAKVESGEIDSQLSRKDYDEYQHLLRSIPEDLRGSPREARGPLYAEIAKLRDKNKILDEVSELESELEGTRRGLDAVQKENAKLRSQLERKAEQLEAIKSRFSWHVSKPIRWIEDQFSRQNSDPSPGNFSASNSDQSK